MIKNVKVNGVIAGTPAEVGVGVFDQLVLPCLKCLNGRPDVERRQFYTGLVGSIMGAMAADFGHQGAKDVFQALTAVFDRLEGDLQAPPETKH